LVRTHRLLLIVRRTADQRDEDAAKAATAEAVDDEVQRRVSDDEQVADSHVEEVGLGAEVGGRVGEDGRQGLGDERRALTEDKDEHDDDEHARDLVLRATVLRLL